MKNGVLYINGKEVEQPFINTNNDKKTVFIDDFTLKELTGEDKVPEGKYFVMGDNRGVSKDSRMIGFIDKSAIEGKGVFTVWAIESYRRIERLFIFISIESKEADFCLFFFWL